MAQVTAVAWIRSLAQELLDPAGEAKKTYIQKCGNPVKLDCDDHYVTTDGINALSNKKKKCNTSNVS